MTHPTAPRYVYLPDATGEPINDADYWAPGARVEICEDRGHHLPPHLPTNHPDYDETCGTCGYNPEDGAPDPLEATEPTPAPRASTVTAADPWAA